MTAVRRLWELFERYDKQAADTLREHKEAATLRREITQDFIDHSDESRPE